MITKELEEEYSNSFAGYDINKSKYKHLLQVDPKELAQISNSIKKELDSNDKFYLHGDYNLY